MHLSELGYTHVSESLEETKIHAEYRHFTFPYLYDRRNPHMIRTSGRRTTFQANRWTSGAPFADLAARQLRGRTGEARGQVVQELGAQ